MAFLFACRALMFVPIMGQINVGILAVTVSQDQLECTNQCLNGGVRSTSLVSGHSYLQKCKWSCAMCSAARSNMQRYTSWEEQIDQPHWVPLWPRLSTQLAGLGLHLCHWGQVIVQNRANMLWHNVCLVWFYFGSKHCRAALASVTPMKNRRPSTCGVWLIPYEIAR